MAIMANVYDLSARTTPYQRVRSTFSNFLGPHMKPMKSKSTILLSISECFACIVPVSTFPQKINLLYCKLHTWKHIFVRYFTWKFLSPDGWVDRYWNKMRIYVSLVRQQLWKFCYAYHSGYMVVVVCQWRTHPIWNSCLELTLQSGGEGGGGPKNIFAMEMCYVHSNDLVEIFHSGYKENV